MIWVNSESPPVQIINEAWFHPIFMAQGPIRFWKQIKIKGKSHAYTNLGSGCQFKLNYRIISQPTFLLKTHILLGQSFGGFLQLNRCTLKIFILMEKRRWDKSVTSFCRKHLQQETDCKRRLEYGHMNWNIQKVSWYSNQRTEQYRVIETLQLQGTPGGLLLKAQSTLNLDQVAPAGSWKLPRIHITRLWSFAPKIKTLFKPFL